MKKISLSALLFVALFALVAVASAFPATVTADIRYSGVNSYWTVDITSPVNDADIPVGTYTGWCADSNLLINAGTHQFRAYNSLTGLPSPIPGTITFPAEWKAVNYVLNHKQSNVYDVQAAIWSYDGGPIAWGVPTGSWGPASKPGTMMALAAANPGYAPGAGSRDVYAVLLKQLDTSGNIMPNTQGIIIEVPVPNIPAPEFPTLALPVALVLGLVFTVYAVKKRED